MDDAKGWKKYFFGGPWKVIYRCSDKNGYQEYLGEKGYWYADPFLFQYKGIYYLFTEAFDIKKQVGKIAVAELEGNQFVNTKLIIDNKYHMSYPCIFEVNNQIFIIPETCENKTLELYRAVSFPYEWEKIVLLQGGDYADSTVFIDGELVYVIAYCDGNLSTKVFKLNMSDYTLNEINHIKHDNKKKRPAGNWFYNEGILYRPTQNCSASYGENLIFNRINNVETLEEVIVKELMPEELGEYIKVHTYNKIGKCEVFDVMEKPNFSVQNFINRVKRKIHRMKYK